jgi:hypothetical protein
MKNIFLIIIILTTTSAFAAQSDPQVKILSTTSDIFYFKVDKDLIGGEVEIIARDGEMLGSQTISKKRTLIDFYSLEPGSYTIIITKGDLHKEFHYEKK